MKKIKKNKAFLLTPFKTKSLILGSMLIPLTYCNSLLQIGNWICFLFIIYKNEGSIK